jgi:hypothetical protein
VADLFGSKAVPTLSDAHKKLQEQAASLITAGIRENRQVYMPVATKYAENNNLRQ